MELSHGTIGGQDCYLLFNGEAFFSLRDIEDLTGTMQDDFEVFCRVVSVMAEQGELYRRYQGHESSEYPSVGDIRLLMSPAEFVEMRRLAITEINDSFERSVKGQERKRDPALEAFKKKPDKKQK